MPFLRHYNVFNAEQIEWPDGSDHAPSDGVEEKDCTAGFEDAAALVDASGAEIVPPHLPIPVHQRLIPPSAPMSHARPPVAPLG
ncbi:MAG: hypothetical protein ABIO70_28425 [Pseudomonadota bacterium]